MEGSSAATKRNHNVVSRRGQSQPPLEEVRPLLSSKSSAGGPGQQSSGPPRSGQFVLPQFITTEKEDDYNHHTHKRKYRVNVPYRMLTLLATVFLLIPLLVFFYKETHVRKEHDHYKPEHHINVNTKDVMSQFSSHVKGKEHEGMDRKDKSSSSEKEKKKDSSSAESDHKEKEEEEVETVQQGDVEEDTSLATDEEDSTKNVAAEFEKEEKEVGEDKQDDEQNKDVSDEEEKEEDEEKRIRRRLYSNQ